jgi:hypothetical protein
MEVTMATEGQRLRAEILALSSVKQARRFGASLRRRVTTYARQRIAAGASLQRVCEELDISTPTLGRFLSAHGAADSGFVEVAIAEKPAIGGFVVRGPCGVLVEGLSLGDLAQLLKGLACSD